MKKLTITAAALAVLMTALFAVFTLGGCDLLADIFVGEDAGDDAGKDVEGKDIISKVTPFSGSITDAQAYLSDGNPIPADGITYTIKLVYSDKSMTLQLSDIEVGTALNGIFSLSFPSTISDGKLSELFSEMSLDGTVTPASHKVLWVPMLAVYQGENQIGLLHYRENDQPTVTMTFLYSTGQLQVVAENDGMALDFEAAAGWNFLLICASDYLTNGTPSVDAKWVFSLGKLDD